MSMPIAGQSGEVLQPFDEGVCMRRNMSVFDSQVDSAVDIYVGVATASI